MRATDGNLYALNRHLAECEVYYLAHSMWDMRCPCCGWVGQMPADTHHTIEPGASDDRYCPECDTTLEEN